MRNKISRYEENQVDRFLYDLYLLWGGNLDEDMCIRVRILYATVWKGKTDFYQSFING